jgi:hypothetical protein
MKASKKFNVGDKVYTDTHSVYQDTQERLSRLSGVVINNDDEYNIHVKIDGKPRWGSIGFSEFELSHTPITEYKNEKF